jgi:hypothetical protein
MTIYQWGKDTARRPWWRLRPSDSPDWHVLNSIAYVYATRERGKLRAHAHYRWESTGNQCENAGVFNSIPQAKRWIESELAKFWDPPTIDPQA